MHLTQIHNSQLNASSPPEYWHCGASLFNCMYPSSSIPPLPFFTPSESLIFTVPSLPVQLFFIPPEINSHSCCCTCRLLISISTAGLPLSVCPKLNPTQIFLKWFLNSMASYLKLHSGSLLPLGLAGIEEPNFFIFFLPLPFVIIYLCAPYNWINLVYSTRRLNVNILVATRCGLCKCASEKDLV